VRLGLVVNQSRKCVINPLVGHAGLSVLLRPCPTVSVSLQAKPSKPVFLLKISSVVVGSPAVWGAMEVTPVELGAISRIRDLFQEMSTTTTNGAGPTVLLNVNTTLKESTNLVGQVNPPLSALNNATLSQSVSTPVIRSGLRTHTPSLTTSPRFKLRSSLTDLLKYIYFKNI